MGICAASDNEVDNNSYLDETPVVGHVIDLLNSGYRWVRTDEGLAVLELKVEDENGKTNCSGQEKEKVIDI